MRNLSSSCWDIYASKQELLLQKLTFALELPFLPFFLDRSFNVLPFLHCLCCCLPDILKKIQWKALRGECLWREHSTKDIPSLFGPSASGRVCIYVYAEFYSLGQVDIQQLPSYSHPKVLVADIRNGEMTACNRTCRKMGRAAVGSGFNISASWALQEQSFTFINCWITQCSSDAYIRGLPCINLRSNMSVVYAALITVIPRVDWNSFLLYININFLKNYCLLQVLGNCGRQVQIWASKKKGER